MYAEYRAVLRDDPDNATALANLGQALYYEGDLDAAVTSLRRSLSNRPEQPRTRLYLAQCYAQQGRRSEAVEEIRAAARYATREDLASSRADLRAALDNHPDTAALRAALDVLESR